MERRHRLKSDPEKTRAFHQRARAKAAAPKPKPPVDRAPTVREVIAATRFRAKAPANDHYCAACRRRRASTWQHWTTQESLRNHVRAIAKDRHYTPRVAGQVLAMLLNDERNLSPFCLPCNMGDHSAAGNVPKVPPPPAAFEFAAELGEDMLERLRRSYP